MFYKAPEQYTVV